MKQMTIRKQRGFFDLGLGLAIAILAAGSTTGHIKTSLHEADMAEQQRVVEAEAKKDLSLIELKQPNLASDNTD